jgi:hypothetical protein
MNETAKTALSERSCAAPQKECAKPEWPRPFDSLRSLGANDQRQDVSPTKQSWLVVGVAFQRRYRRTTHVGFTESFDNVRFEKGPWSVATKLRDCGAGLQVCSTGGLGPVSKPKVSRARRPRSQSPPIEPGLCPFRLTQGGRASLRHRSARRTACRSATRLGSNTAESTSPARDVEQRCMRREVERSGRERFDDAECNKQPAELRRPTL